MFSSFSMRATVHVEYTSEPPRATREAALLSISSCRRAVSQIMSGAMRQRISGCRRRVPRPEQGASRNTRSKGMTGLGGLFGDLSCASSTGSSGFNVLVGDVWVVGAEFRCVASAGNAFNGDAPSRRVASAMSV